MKFISQIRRTLGTAGLSLLVLVGLMAAAPNHSYAAALATGSKATVANTGGDNIRVRDGAGTDHKQIAEAHEGETVSVLAGPVKDSSGSTWFKVQAPGGTGWIMSDFLASKAGSTSSPAQTTKDNSKGQSSSQQPQQPAKPQTPSGPKLAGFARVGNSDGDPVRLRTAPISSGSIMTLFDASTSVAVKAGPQVDSDGIAWYQVSAQGKTGWMMAQYLIQADAPATPAPAATAPAPAQTPKPAPAPPAQPPVQPTPAPAPPQAQPAIQIQPVAAPAPVVDVSATRGNTAVGIAMKYLGYRYIFGGTSPRGFDCSGFVYYVYNKQMGMSIGRDLYSQLNSGTRVSRANLQAGDILIFANTYKGGISHAGIYIGGGRFIHAENESAGVAISSLNESYWANHYYAAARPR